MHAPGARYGLRVRRAGSSRRSPGMLGENILRRPGHVCRVDHGSLAVEVEDVHQVDLDPDPGGSGPTSSGTPHRRNRRSRCLSGRSIRSSFRRSRRSSRPPGRHRRGGLAGQRRRRDRRPSVRQEARSRCPATGRVPGRRCRGPLSQYQNPTWPRPCHPRFHPRLPTRRARVIVEPSGSVISAVGSISGGQTIGACCQRPIAERRRRRCRARAMGSSKGRAADVRGDEIGVAQPGCDDRSGRGHAKLCHVVHIGRPPLRPPGRALIVSREARRGWRRERARAAACCPRSRRGSPRADR